MLVAAAPASRISYGANAFLTFEITVYCSSSQVTISGKTAFGEFENAEGWVGHLHFFGDDPDEKSGKEELSLAS